MPIPTLEGVKPTDAHLRLIGLIVVEWGRLERAIEAAIWGLLRIIDDKIGMALTTHIPPRVRLDIVLTLADKMLSPAEKQELESIIDRLNELHPDRNLVAHDEWVPTVTHYVRRVTARGGELKTTLYTVELATLEKVAADISQLADQASALRFKYAARM